MGVFIFLYVALVLIYLISTLIPGDNKRLFQTIFCFLLLWLIQGLRHESIGVDSATTYRPYFESLGTGIGSILDFDDGFANFELGYVALNKFFKTFISSDTKVFILFTSFLCIAPVAFIFYKYSCNIVFSFWIFASLQIYHFGFSGIRQAIALGICFYAFHYIIKENLVAFVILVILASLFHTSALLFLPAYWAYYKFKITKLSLLVSLVGIVMATFFIKSIATGIVSLLFGGERYLSALEVEGGVSYNLLILFIFVLFFTYISKDETVNRLRPFLLFTVAFQTLGIVSPYATRIGYYYYMFFPIVIPLVVKTTKFFNNKLLITMLLCGLLTMFFFYVNGSGYLNVIPYKFFWE